MRGLRFDRLLSGAALALPLTVVLAIPCFQRPSQHPDPGGHRIRRPDAGDRHARSAHRGRYGDPVRDPGNRQFLETSPAATAPAETATPAEPAATTPADTTATVTPAEASPPPDPLASLDPADRPIAERIRDMLPKADRTYSSRRERLAVEAFYQKRNYAPVWFERGTLSARTNAAIARIHASAADGLIPAEYKIPDMNAASPDAQADAELRLTAALVTFTRHLQAGRFPSPAWAAKS